MKHFIDPMDFSMEETEHLLTLAERIAGHPEAYADVASRRKIATLFYEPSTRTRLSFETAMMNLGGLAIGFPASQVSSVSKGETVADTIRVVSCYADTIFSDMVCCLLSNVCVATSFYLRSANHVSFYPFFNLRNLSYLILIYQMF